MLSKLYNQVYETIDALVLSYEKTPRANLTIYEYLILRQPDLVFVTLQAPTNKPSVHDLMLINVTIREMKASIKNNAGRYWIDTYNGILQFYKDRKVLS